MLFSTAHKIFVLKYHQSVNIRKCSLELNTDLLAAPATELIRLQQEALFPNVKC
jgi:hypothetical protein